MTQSDMTEVWLRGPVPGIPFLLQPVAHALLQAREEVNALMIDFPEDYLWKRPAGVASVGFHLQHIAGVPDRLFTYARGESLSKAQLNALSLEGKSGQPGLLVMDFVRQFDKQVDIALEQLSKTNENTLSEPRGVGRAQIPSTQLGLLVHAAEHVQRHLGQLIVTVKILVAEKHFQA